MKSRPLFALLYALVLPVVAQTTFQTPAKPGSPEAAESGSLDIARSGDEVFLAWTLPEGEVRLLEIMRNTTSSAQGRGRVSGLRNSITVYLDKVPDTTVTYWYWIKITRPDGRIVNIGPVATPSATVWAP